MSHKLRWGIISTARINNSLIKPIKRAQRSELVAVASRSMDKAAAYAREKGIPRPYGSYEELIADPEIDAIYNPLPNDMHCEWTVKAAEAGKHVLCEKPLVTTIAELDQIEQAAQQNNVTVFEAFMYLHHPQIAKVRELLNAGALGNLQLIRGMFTFYLSPADVNNVRLKPELGGGSMWDVGVYPNSLAIVMAGAGAPVEVWAQQVIGDSGVDMTMRAQLRFSNDVVAQIYSGFRAPFKQVGSLHGDRGHLTLTGPWVPAWRQRVSPLVPHMLVYKDHKRRRRPIFVPYADPYAHEVAAMEACVFDGAEPVVPLSLSRQFLKSALAIYKSAETGKPVSV